jgi:hypothetical protein
MRVRTPLRVAHFVSRLLSVAVYGAALTWVLISAPGRAVALFVLVFGLVSGLVTLWIWRRWIVIPGRAEALFLLVVGLLSGLVTFWIWRR